MLFCVSSNLLVEILSHNVFYGALCYYKLLGHREKYVITQGSRDKAKSEYITLRLYNDNASD